MILLRRHVERLLRFRRTVVAIVLAISVGLGLAASELQIMLDPNQVLPAHHPFIVADRAIADEFGGKRFLVVALVPREGTVWSVPVLRYLDELTLALYKADGVRATNVLSLASPNARDIRATGDSLDIQYLMREAPHTEADVAAIREAYLRNPLYHGTLVSEDERAAMILVDFWSDAVPHQGFETTTAVIAAHPSQDVDVHLTGLPVFGAYFRDYARSMGGYFALALAAIMVVLYAAFGSLQGTLIPLATGILATVWGLGHG